MEIEEILEGFRPPEDVVPLCLRSDLQVEWEKAVRELQDAQAKAGDSLAGTSKAVSAAAKQVKALEEQMAASTVEFHLRAVGSLAWSDLKKAHPPREGQFEEWNAATFGVAVLAACSVAPKMTEEQAGRLVDKITEGQWETFQRALGKLNRSDVSVPFYKSASEILQS